MVAALAVAALVIVVVVAVIGDDDAGVVQRALSQLDDDARFDTAYEAGDTFASIGGRLQEEGESRDSLPLLSASAYAQVLAVRVLSCTAPGRFEARAALRELLEAVADLEPDDPVPSPPSPPSCR